jgi:hypothetical protein
MDARSSLTNAPSLQAPSVLTPSKGDGAVKFEGSLLRALEEDTIMAWWLPAKLADDREKLL